MALGLGLAVVGHGLVVEGEPHVGHFLLVFLPTDFRGGIADLFEDGAGVEDHLGLLGDELLELFVLGLDVGGLFVNLCGFGLDVGRLGLDGLVLLGNLFLEVGDLLFLGGYDLLEVLDGLLEVGVGLSGFLLKGVEAVEFFLDEGYLLLDVGGLVHLSGLVFDAQFEGVGLAGDFGEGVEDVGEFVILRGILFLEAQVVVFKLGVVG